MAFEDLDDNEGMGIYGSDGCIEGVDILKRQDIDGKGMYTRAQVHMRFYFLYCSYMNETAKKGGLSLKKTRRMPSCTLPLPCR